MYIISYLGKDVPSNIPRARRSGERAGISVILVGAFSHWLGVKGPQSNVSLFVYCQRFLPQLYQFTLDLYIYIYTPI